MPFSPGNPAVRGREESGLKFPVIEMFDDQLHVGTAANNGLPPQGGLTSDT